MSTPENEFDVGPGDELQSKYGWYAANWVPPALDDTKIPDGLRHLVPLAQRWGITCDVTRHDAARLATDAELISLREQLKGTHSLYEDWSFGALDSFASRSTENSVFGAMYRFETEAAGGPGFGSRLDWAIRRFQGSPDTENRDRLQSALDWVVARGRGFMKPRQESIGLARRLLDGDF
jgi:hypothetical protein